MPHHLHFEATLPQLDAIDSEKVNISSGNIANLNKEMQESEGYPLSGKLNIV